MERRSQNRRPTRVQVHFWEQGSEKRSMGYTVNVSNTGMYITTNQLLPPGTRIRAELRAADGQSAMLESVVARAERSMRQLRPDAMGVRFLTARELVGEVVPETVSPEPTSSTSVAESGDYTLRFTERERFLEAYRRDLSTGGLFIPSDQPAPLNEVITIELRVADSPPMQLQARVVQRFEPGGGSPLAGMGVEILSLEKAMEALKALAASFE